MSIRDEYIKAGIIKPVEKKSASSQALVDELVRLVLNQGHVPNGGATKTKKAAKKPKQKVEAAPPPSSKKKKYPPKPLVASEIIKHRSPVHLAPLRCPLCGEVVRWGKMEEHKISNHGESAEKPKPQSAPVELPRAVFVRGGAPGLKG